MGKVAIGKTGIQLPQLTTKAKIIVAVTVVVFAGAIGLWVFTSYLQANLDGSGKVPIVSKDEFKKQTVDSRSATARSAALDALNAGSDKDAMTIYENAVSAEPDPAAKVQLASEQSRILQRAGKNDQAIAVLKEAINYNSDKYQAYDLLARTYQQAKLYAAAAEYYQKAGQLVNSPTNIGQYTKKFYDLKAEQMLALVGKG